MDKNNLGPSYIVGVGDYTGGEVWVHGMGEMHVKGKWLSFDGRLLPRLCSPSHLITPLARE